MKIASKAALLSAFVFPGTGQLYLKKYWRGLSIMLFVFTGLGYLIWQATIVALKSLDEVMAKAQGSAPNVQEISNIVGSKMLNSAPYYDIIFYAIICFWIFAVIDAYRLGKQKDDIG